MNWLAFQVLLVWVLVNVPLLLVLAWARQEVSAAIVLKLALLVRPTLRC